MPNTCLLPQHAESLGMYHKIVVYVRTTHDNPEGPQDLGVSCSMLSSCRNILTCPSRAWLAGWLCSKAHSGTARAGEKTMRFRSRLIVGHCGPHPSTEEVRPVEGNSNNGELGTGCAHGPSTIRAGCGDSC